MVGSDDKRGDDDNGDCNDDDIDVDDCQSQQNIRQLVSGLLLFQVTSVLFNRKTKSIEANFPHSIFRLKLVNQL